MSDTTFVAAGKALPLDARAYPESPPGLLHLQAAGHRGELQPYGQHRPEGSTAEPDNLPAVWHIKYVFGTPSVCALSYTLTQAKTSSKTRAPSTSTVRRRTNIK